MPLVNVKSKLEMALVAQVLGKGYKAGMWHFEDEPAEDLAFQYKLQELRNSIFTDIVGDAIFSSKHKGPVIVSGRVLCGLCLEVPLEVSHIQLPHKALYSAEGVSGWMQAHCKRCKKEFKVVFSYPDNWTHGTHIDIRLISVEPDQENFI